MGEANTGWLITAEILAGLPYGHIRVTDVTLQLISTC